MKLTLVLLAAFISGCAHAGRLRTERVKVDPPANAQAPSVVNSGEKITETVIPAGTQKRTVETQATSTTPATTETVYTFPSETKETIHEQTDSVTLANSRAPDQAVALAKIAATERRYLLFIGIGLGIAAIAIKSLLPLWPGLWKGAALGAVLALAAWKLSEIPSWIWAVAIGVSALIALGYKRGELDKNGNGIPDFLEHKK